MNNKELKHCTTCNQMTNHRGDTCLKHMNDTEIEATEEMVDRGTYLATTRLKVPGGWMYRAFHMEHNMMGVCFVPEIEITHVDLSKTDVTTNL
jgi:hypothetical protein